MAAGLSMWLTRQIGEHLVTAELRRRRIIATPFAGNVSGVDILAYENGVSVPVQVKAINGDSWQCDIRTFLDVIITDKGQRVRGPKKLLDRNVFCDFVAVRDTAAADEFYLFRLGWLQDSFQKTYHGRKPPRSIPSFHCAIWKHDLTLHLGNWRLLERKVKL